MSIEQITPTAEVPAITSLKRAVLYTRVSTSRQASKNGESEGYSIPAQRTACQRKAQELGAEIVEEFVDAGASARSADREGLQEMLAYVKKGNVDYVLVHKLDRLARDRADDVAILAAIQSAGAVLVSATEQIDESPPGMLMHGIMATMAEFYSRNLANEAKKGIAQKAKNGGTHGVAPLGYVNTNTRIEGRDIKGVAIDTERAELIRWAFRTYATGDLSISTLRDELEERGLRSRKTAKYVGTPLNNSQVHRMLSNPYYIGKVKHREAIYDGIHESLIDDDTWYTVQEVLAGRRIAGDRSWRHTHYLKGSLTCHRCGGRMGFGYSQGRGGIYSYFFCLGRHTGRTECDLPYVGTDFVEKEMERIWRSQVQFTTETIAQVGQASRAQLVAQQGHDEALLASQRQRLITLERQKQKLIDAYLDDIIPAEDLKRRQTVVMSEMQDAKRLIGACQQNMTTVLKHLDLILLLLKNAGRLYEDATPEQRKWLNQAVFKTIEIDVAGENPRAEDARFVVKVAGVLAEPVAAVTGLAQMGTSGRIGSDVASHGPTQAPTGNEAGQNETPGALSHSGGSNVNNLAVTVGFEPTVGGYPTQLFESCTFGRSDTSPRSSVVQPRGRVETGLRGYDSDRALEPARPVRASPRSRVVPPGPRTG